MMHLAVLLSGRGSNFKAIKNAVDKKLIPDTEIVCVISDKENADGLKYAASQNIKSIFISPRDYKSRQEFDEKILDILHTYKADLICLAGYMRIVSDVLINAYYGRMINIHPSLLPSFPGLNAQKQALEYGVKISGCTVHFVDRGTDTGTVIAQSVVEVFDNDDEKSLSDRILEREHILYPEVVSLYAQGRIKLNGRKVTVVKQ